MRVVIITGMSGSGKSTALKALEDIGYFCVDNLPILLLQKLIDLGRGISYDINKVALVMDIREPTFLEKHIDVISTLKKKKYNIEILFLEASDDVLLRRFSETRRTHPLSGNCTIPEAISREREMLRELKGMAQNVIDTSHVNVHKLKEQIQNYFLTPSRLRALTINLISFGYRYGLPPDADNVFDVRFLPNPYFIDSLKRLSGNDSAIEEYVIKWNDTTIFLDKMKDWLAYLIPQYEREGKAYITIAVGCTGGRHRSVVIVNQLKTFLTAEKLNVNINHRDIEKESLSD